MTSFFGDSHYFSIPIAQVLQVPQKLSLPLSAMQGYTYTPSAPQNLRARLAQDGYAYVSWAPVYGADHYYVYKSLTPDGPDVYKRQADIWSISEVYFYVPTN